MILHNLYYKDLFQSDKPMRVQYDKYHELHRMKHLRRSATRRAFAQRIQQYGRSVGEAIQRPNTGKVGERKGGEYWQERKNRKGEKPKEKTYIARRRKGLSMEKSFSLLRTNISSKRHDSPEPKCKINTYYTRIYRGYTHEQAISPDLMRQTVSK